MMSPFSSSTSSPTEGADNDQLNGNNQNGTNGGTVVVAGGDNSNVPKPKRLACMICRKRKLKCDGVKPSCSTCTRLGHSCAYDEVRRKSGPKRGYVKALEERLKQVETQLKTQELSNGGDAASGKNGVNRSNEKAAGKVSFDLGNPSIGIASSRDMDRWQFNGESPTANAQGGGLGAPGVDEFNFNSVDSNFTWEIINLGLEEPLPPQETIDELHQIYFEKIHPSMPMIHRYRYLAAMNLAPSQRPPVALRYSMWTLACSVTDKYYDLKDLFYQRARKYMESDYMKGYGEHLISVAHTQTHVLLASYEFKMMYFPRAWMSTGQAVRMAQMIGLHRLDGAGLDVKQCLPPPRDWTEREERRRTFWMAFAEDRYASIGTGWPMVVDERDILTNLPATEEAFDMSRPEQTIPLADAMHPSGAAKLSSFGGIVLMACLFGRNLIHLHRPDIDDRDHDLDGLFWKRHRAMDNILLNTSLCLPEHLKLPAGLSNANVIYTNMCIHTSTICLHQAAIFKADKNRLPAAVGSESKIRCISAANETAAIMRMISHMDLSAMNPFISFCLYVAARVFVQYLKSRPDDGATADSLRFLLAAMNALKRKNPLTESFLVQLDVDLEALGARIPKLKSAFPRSADSPTTRDVPAPAITRPGAQCDEGVAQNGILAYDLQGQSGEGVPDSLVDPSLAAADKQSAQPPSTISLDNTNATAAAFPWLGVGATAAPVVGHDLPTRDRTTGGPSPPSLFHQMQGLAYSNGGGNAAATAANNLLLVGTSGSSATLSTAGFETRSDVGQNSSSRSTTTNNDPSGTSPGTNPGVSAEQRQGGLTAGVPTSGHTSSFEASPVSPQRNLENLERAGAFFADLASGNPSGGGGGGAGSGAGGGFGGWEMHASLAAAHAHHQHQAGMQRMQQQQMQGMGGLHHGMGQGSLAAQGAEGILRNIIALDPMEGMDMGWDQQGLMADD